jgi:tRNA threonylcarbamoyladenosine biosynthesis protein TsaB
MAANAKPGAAYNTSVDQPRLLLIETSQRRGFVALAEGPRLLGQRRLDEARRHARDLAPACARLLDDQGWKARDLAGVIVSRGPGSYTGLRVGVMSAKTLAYAAGCALLAVDTFPAIAWQAPAEARVLDVVADAQQDRVYRERFARDDADVWRTQTPLAILSVADWLPTLSGAVWVAGPGLENLAARLPGVTPIAPQPDWTPRPEGLLTRGLQRWERGERDDPFTLEPLYLRPSSAEEKWQADGA